MENEETFSNAPVVDSTFHSEGEFMVGAFITRAQGFDCETAVVEISTKNDGSPGQNLTTIQDEERVALTGMRPENYVHGGFEEEAP